VDNLERLIIDLKDSLEREIRELHAGISRIEIRFDNQAARLDRHAALLQTGSRWTGRMNDWAEKIDQALETKDREIAELRARLEKLERRNGHPAA
jgi:predicted  nucleic acid-binding Zn-ribbon protein